MRKFIVLFLCSFLFFSCGPTQQVDKSYVINEGDFKFLKISETNNHPDLYLLINKDGSYSGAQYRYTTSDEDSTELHTGIVDVAQSSVNEVVKDKLSVDDAISIIDAYLAEINNSSLSTSDKLKKLSVVYDKLETLSSTAYKLKNEAYKTFISQ